MIAVTVVGFSVVWQLAVAKGRGGVVRTVDWCSVTACSGQGGAHFEGVGNTLHSFGISDNLIENCRKQMLETKNVYFCKIKIKHFINFHATIAPKKIKFLLFSTEVKKTFSA